MERTHPEITGTVLAHSRSDTLFHLARSLIGKGERQYRPRLNPLFKKMGYLVCQDSCLSGTCTCYHHAVAVGIQNGIALAWVQFTLVIDHFIMA